MNTTPQRSMARAVAAVLTLALMVPLSQTKARPALAAIRSDNLVTGQLSYHGGTVMSNPTNYVIFWLPSGQSFEPAGSAYTDAQYEALIQQYFQDVCGTKYYDILTPLSYSPPDNPVVKGGPIQNACTFGGAFVDTTPYPHAGTTADPLNGGDLQASITRARNANSGWVTGFNAEYFVYTGYQIQECGSSECTFPTAPNGPFFCAYHTNAGETIYAFISDGIVNGNKGCSVGTSPNDGPADSAADTTSHEQFEAVSDPFGDGWYNGDGAHENGDQCNFYFGSADKNSDGTNLIFNSHKYRLQWEWLNQLGSPDSSGDYGNSGCAPSYCKTDGGVEQPCDATAMLTAAATPKTVSGNPGDKVAFTFNYANTSGTDGAYDTKLEVNLPASLKYASTDGGLSPTQNGQKLTYTIGTLGVGATGQITVRATLASALPDGATASANAVFDGNDQLGHVAFFPPAQASVTVENSPPFFLGIPSHTVDFHDALSFTVEGIDSDVGDTLTLKASGLPDGLSFTDKRDGTGTVSGTVTAAPGTYPVTFSVNDGHHADVTTTANIVVTKEETAVAAGGDALIAAGSNTAHLSGTLTEDGTTPLSGRTLTLTLGTGASSQSCTTGLTDATGKASCTISPVTVPLGPQTVTASFAGDTYYLSSSGTTTAIVFGFLSRGAFALGDKSVASATASTTLTWWADTWYQLNALSGGQAPSSYKGFMASLSSTPPACGGTFTTSTGNSVVPPATVPSYMGIAVTDKVTKNGSMMAGKIAKIVVVKTNPGYAAQPVSPGTGTIVGTYCSL